MGFHHIAFAVKDMEATHAFYTEVMGFELAKCVVAPTIPANPREKPTGWSKHFFYDTGNGELMGFWELHDPGIGDDWKAPISSGLGLPSYVNHFAFSCDSYEALVERRTVWLEHGITVPEVDHDFCVSIYAHDPNGNMVEFSWTRRPFTDEERRHAREMVTDQHPELQKEGYATTVHRPEKAAASARS